VAHVSQPKLGERVNGDAVLVRSGSDVLLLAVIDGLGHGPIAAEAAQAAIAALNGQKLEAPVLDMMQSIHAQLRGTRGVAATVCIVRGRAVEACAVGNVQLSCANASVPLVLSAGVLGMRVPKFRVCIGQLRTGARLAIFTDGLSTRVGLEEVRNLGPDAACRQLFERHRKKEDDATILIADLDG
jgi:negative regulator of sigma-B (phosphoserine phosphatase)